ncbi:MAG: ABC transporter substrate-binding protein [Deltaproteobacteria bacterium]|nr:ABC transporter substrate-binding protein [Deltaproteobacteria bacterium]
MITSKAATFLSLSRGRSILGRTFAAVLALSLVLLPGCRREAVPETKDDAGTLTVGSILVLSGPNSHYGEDTKAGMEMGLQYVNEQGISYTTPSGDRRDIRLNIEFKNSHGGPNNTINAPEQLQELVNAGMPVILGAFFSSVTLSLGPIANDRGVVLLTPCSTNYKLREAGPLVFRILPTDYDQAVKMADYARDELKATKGAVLYIQNDYGQDLANTFVGRFEETGGKVVYNRFFVEGTREFGGFINQLLDSGAEHLFLAGHTQEMVDILRTKQGTERRRNVRPLPVLGTDGMYDDSFLEQAGDAADGIVLASAGFDPQANDPVVRSFVSAFQERFGREPNLWSAGGYDAVLVLAEAIRSGGPSAAGIQGGLKQIQGLSGATGINTVDETGGMSGKEVHTFVVRGGRFERREETSEGQIERAAA